MMAFKFERLVVWQKAVDLYDTVNQVCEFFPKDELYILVSQMKRAADSVSLNIAEGSTGQSNPEFSRFLAIALRSNVEVVCCLHLAKKRRYITQEAFDNLYFRCEEILRMINALRFALNKKS